MAKIPKNKYHCTQSALYSVCDTIARNLQSNLADFTAFKGEYTMSFVTALHTAINDAVSLPDEQARGAKAETLRVQLASLNNHCLRNWQSLKRYIEAAYFSAEWKPRLEAAGSGYYRRASQKSWKDTVPMNVSAGNFIAANTVTLEKGGLGMPAAFPAQYAAAALACFTGYNLFKAAAETGVPTEEKIIANNTLYRRVIEICKDGTVIYKNDAAKTKLFTWSTVLDIVAPAINSNPEPQPG